MDVVQLAERRAARQEADEAICNCGSHWFELRPMPGEPAIAPHGAVAMTAAGSIRAYNGMPVCIECGSPWLP